MGDVLEVTLSGAECSPREKEREPVGADPFAVLYYGTRQHWVAKLIKDLKFGYNVESGVDEVNINVYDGNKPEPREAIAHIKVPLSMTYQLGCDSLSCPIMKSNGDTLGTLKLATKIIPKAESQAPVTSSLTAHSEQQPLTPGVYGPPPGARASPPPPSAPSNQWQPQQQQQQQNGGWEMATAVGNPVAPPPQQQYEMASQHPPAYGPPTSYPSYPPPAPPPPPATYYPPPAYPPPYGYYPPPAPYYGGYGGYGSYPSYYPAAPTTIIIEENNGWGGGYGGGYGWGGRGYGGGYGWGGGWGGDGFLLGGLGGFAGGMLLAEMF